MKNYYLQVSERGEITQIDQVDGLVIAAPAWATADPAATLGSHYVPDLDSGELISRPRLFDADLVILSPGEKLTRDVPRRTQISFERPDLPLTDKGRVQRFSEELTTGQFEFLSEKPGSFKVSFSDCFPFAEQTVTLMVRDQ